MLSFIMQLMRLNPLPQCAMARMPEDLPLSALGGGEGGGGGGWDGHCEQERGSHGRQRFDAQQTLRIVLRERTALRHPSSNSEAFANLDGCWRRNAESSKGPHLTQPLRPQGRRGADRNFVFDQNA